MGWTSTIHMDSQFLAEHLSVIGTAIGVVALKVHAEVIRTVGIELHFAGNHLGGYRRV